MTIQRIMDMVLASGFEERLYHKCGLLRRHGADCIELDHIPFTDSALQRLKAIGSGRIGARVANAPPRTKPGWAETALSARPAGLFLQAQRANVEIDRRLARYHRS